MEKSTNHKRVGLDQYGNTFYFTTIKDLRSQVGMGGSRVGKMYQDTKNGPECIGRVIGHHWITFYVAVQC